MRLRVLLPSIIFSSSGSSGWLLRLAVELHRLSRESRRNLLYELELAELADNDYERANLPEPNEPRDPMPPIVTVAREFRRSAVVFHVSSISLALDAAVVSR